MANPTLSILMSRILVLDQGIDYEIKNKKRRGGSKTGQKKYENKKSKKMKLKTVGRGAV